MVENAARCVLELGVRPLSELNLMFMQGKAQYATFFTFLMKKNAICLPVYIKKLNFERDLYKKTNHLVLTK